MTKDDRILLRFERLEQTVDRLRASVEFLLEQQVDSSPEWRRSLQLHNELRGLLIDESSTRGLSKSHQ